MAPRKKQEPKKIVEEEVATEAVVEEEVDQAADAVVDAVPKEEQSTETPPEVAPEIEPKSNWEVVPHLSDGEMVVEAVNISAYQRNALLLRFRVDGKLTGEVLVADRLHCRDGVIKAPA